VSPLHLLPLGSTPLEPDLETLWKDRLVILVSNIVFIVLTSHNSLSTLILFALDVGDSPRGPLKQLGTPT
jgi:hypothetical protein